MTSPMPVLYDVKLFLSEQYSTQVMARTDGEADWVARQLFGLRPELLVSQGNDIDRIEVAEANLPKMEVTA